jgi:hypothetical protein
VGAAAVLDSWVLPPFQNEHYLFSGPMIKKHHDTLVWAGMQIAAITQAAIDELAVGGSSAHEAAERLRAVSAQPAAQRPNGSS